MGTNHWIGSGGQADPVPQDTKNVQLAEGIPETYTFMRSIITYELIHVWSGSDISELPVWAPVAAAAYWRGMLSDLAPRHLFDAGGDYSCYQGVDWTVDNVEHGPGIVTVYYRGKPPQGIMDVNGERRLIRYTDPSNIYWLTVGHTQAGPPPAGVSLRTFTIAWTARNLYLEP